MFHKKVTQTIVLLLLPSVTYGLVVGTSITILRDTHPFYGQTGIVVNVGATGASVDYDGDGERELDGGIALSTEGVNWAVSGTTPPFPVNVGDKVEILREPVNDYMNWARPLRNPYTVTTVTNTIVEVFSGTYSGELDYNWTLEGGHQNPFWRIYDPSNQAQFPLEQKRFHIRFIQGVDPAGGDYGFLVVLDVGCYWHNTQQCQFTVADPKIFKTKIQTAYIYSGQGNAGAYADTVYKLKKINIYPLDNTLDAPKNYLNSISADANNPSQYTNITDNSATYTFKYHIHVTWDIIGSSNPTAPDVWTAYHTDEIALNSTYN